MSKLSMFAAGIVLAMGCGSNDPLDKAIAGLEDWKNKMCACKDKACVEKVQEDYKKWENDVLEPSLKGKKKSDFPKDKMEKGDKLDKERKECRRKYRDADGGEPAPTPTESGDPATP